MINPYKFNAQDPFPLVSHALYNYAEAKNHALDADRWLGLNTTEVERIVRGNPRYSTPSEIPSEYWTHKDVQVTQTPYIECRRIVEDLNFCAGQTLVDLGCGYGRMAHVIGHYYPESYFIGYEFVSERVTEGARALSPFTYSKVRLEQADLSLKTFSIPKADAYFIYDFGSRWAIEKTVRDLAKLSKSKSITVVGRGRATRDEIERHHPWLSEVVPPVHFKNYSIYRTAHLVRS